MLINRVDQIKALENQKNKLLGDDIKLARLLQSAFPEAEISSCLPYKIYTHGTIEVKLKHLTPQDIKAAIGNQNNKLKISNSKFSSLTEFLEQPTAPKQNERSHDVTIDFNDTETFNAVCQAAYRESAKNIAKAIEELKEAHGVLTNEWKVPLAAAHEAAKKEIAQATGQFTGQGSGKAK
jgi:hypothetical protein